MYNKHIFPIIEEKAKIPVMIWNLNKMDNSIIIGVWRSWDYRKDKNDVLLDNKNIVWHNFYIKREQQKVLWVQDILLLDRWIIKDWIFEALKSYNFYEKLENHNDKHYENINYKLKALWVHDLNKFISRDIKKISNFLSGLSYNEYMIMLSIIENKIEDSNKSYEIRKLAGEKRFEIIKNKFKNNEIITKFFDHSSEHILSQEKIDYVIDYFITKYKNNTELEKEIENMLVKMQKYEQAVVMKDIYKIKKWIISIIYEVLSNKKVNL